MKWAIVLQKTKRPFALKSIWAEPWRMKGSEAMAKFDKDGGSGGEFKDDLVREKY